MKNRSTMIKTVFLAGLLSWQVHAAEQTNNKTSPLGPETTIVSSNPKIQKLLKDEAINITKEFPYRINLFTQGQVDKNAAGVRFAEKASQLLSDNTGLLFYYEVVNDGMRVPHWHSNATEIGTVISGKMRVTIWEGSGDTKVYTVEKNGTWIIPKAKLHSLENVGQEKMKFVVVYDSPIAADRDFLTAWASLPDAVLARAVGLTESDIAGIKKTTVNRLSAFDPAASTFKTDNYSVLSNNFMTTKPLYQSDLGSITRIDPTVNSNMNAMALQRTILKPQVLRTPHWYTTGDVLLFVLRGEAFFTLMDNDGKVYHSVVHPGDVISIPVGNFHSFLNIGNDDLEVYEGFNRVEQINEITLMNGVQHFNLGTIAGATGLNKELIQKIDQEKAESYMMKF